MFKKQSKYASFGRTTHGMKKNELYNRWSGMRARCNNPKHISYPSYGALGIRVCKRWDDFKKFHEDMFQSYLIHVKKHGKDKTSIDRINSKKDYSPSNCRWATPLEQGRRTSRVVLVEHEGQIKSITEWAKYLGLNYTTLYLRYIRYGRLITIKKMKNYYSSSGKKRYEQRLINHVDIS